MSNNFYMRKPLIEAVKQYALEYGNFTLKSGAQANFYLDLRKLSLSGRLYLIVEELHQVIGDTEFDAIGGVCVGADPLVGGYLALRGYDTLHGFLIRKEEKQHGKASRIIGSVQPGDNCIMVEDVTTSGQSVIEAIMTIQEFGAKVVKAISIVDREQGARDAFERIGIPFEPVLTLQDLGIKAEAI